MSKQTYQPADAERFKTIISHVRFHGDFYFPGRESRKLVTSSRADQ
jgi:hypothetical protein